MINSVTSAKEKIAHYVLENNNKASIYEMLNALDIDTDIFFIALKELFKEEMLERNMETTLENIRKAQMECHDSLGLISVAEMLDD